MKYRIVSWAEYQHYKDRCPPWIKLHGSLLTSEVWVLGNDASRALAIASMLLASRNKANDGTFNGDPEYVKRVCYLNSLPNFKPLIDNGFIEVVQDASNVLAECNTEESRGEESTREESPIREPSGFAEFWSAYPKKVGKAEARKAFAKARINGHLPDVLKAISEQAASEQWRKEGGQFIPNPATWIRQGRWEDESISTAPRVRQLAI